MILCCQYCNGIDDYKYKKAKLLHHLEYSLPEGKILSVCDSCFSNLINHGDAIEVKNECEELDDNQKEVIDNGGDIVIAHKGHIPLRQVRWFSVTPESHAKRKYMKFRKLMDKIKCKIGKNERVYWAREQCEDAGIMYGIFAPWECKRCGYKSSKFPYLKCPMPPINSAISCIKNCVEYKSGALPIILEGDCPMLDLGDKVKDRITGFTGIAVGKTDWIYGCTRIGVQPEMDKEGKLQEVQWFDTLSLDVVEKNTINRQKNMEKETTEYVKTGGPMPFTPKRNKEESR